LIFLVGLPGPNKACLQRRWTHQTLSLL
jgi:hypothetical protein